MKTAALLLTFKKKFDTGEQMLKISAGNIG
jgi:hypothetical protein